MIGQNLREHLSLVAICKRFSMLLECFRKCSASFTPNQTTRPGRGPDDQRFWLSLEACITERLKFSWDFSAGNECGIRIIFFVTSARKPSGSWQCEQDKRVSSDILSSTFQNSFFQRVKLQTSLYHPIPLDSKPYKQTNRLENILLSLGTILLFCPVFFVFSRFYLFILIYILFFFERLSEMFQHSLFSDSLHHKAGIQLAVRANYRLVILLAIVCITFSTVFQPLQYTAKHLFLFYN